MREDVQAGYDEIAEEYAVTTGESSASKPFLEDLDNRLDEGARILDVGCGNGTPALNNFVDQFDVIGLDISREQLRLAAKTVPAAPLLQGEMTALPVGRSIIDAVVALYSIIHVPRSDHQAVFEEWARVLRPGGWVLFSSGTEGWAGRNPDWLDSGVEMVWSYPGPDETITALEAAGFELVGTHTVPDSIADTGEKQLFLARLTAQG
ncbi:class I SAM-dependent methyltransferase [Halodesulfurarchaeum sp.]|uniref:class I SAM-dependent methyltransferase n=1 Tax=Halodesulfurarchaeum sp. TaxID=1980530 RepID=UPI002FC3BB4D